MEDIRGKVYCDRCQEIQNQSFEERQKYQERTSHAENTLRDVASENNLLKFKNELLTERVNELLEERMELRRQSSELQANLNHLIMTQRTQVEQIEVTRYQLYRNETNLYQRPPNHQPAPQPHPSPPNRWYEDSLRHRSLLQGNPDPGRQRRPEPPQ